MNRMPEPATKSVTVRDTSTSPGPASAATRMILHLGVTEPYGVHEHLLLNALDDVGWRRGSGAAWLPPAGRRLATGIESLHQNIKPAAGFAAEQRDASWQERQHFVPAAHLGNRAWEIT